MGFSSPLCSSAAGCSPLAAVGSAFKITAAWVRQSVPPEGDAYEGHGTVRTGPRMGGMAVEKFAWPHSVHRHPGQCHSSSGRPARPMQDV